MAPMVGSRKSLVVVWVLGAVLCGCGQRELVSTEPTDTRDSASISEVCDVVREKLAELDRATLELTMTPGATSVIPAIGGLRRSTYESISLLPVPSPLSIAFRQLASLTGSDGGAGAETDSANDRSLAAAEVAKRVKSYCAIELDESTL